MRLAMREAERALEHEDVPVGAVMVQEGEVLGGDATSASCGRTRPRMRRCSRSGRRTQARATGDCSTASLCALEPCADVRGRGGARAFPRVVFGASDPKAGAAGSVLDVLGDARLNRPDRGSGGGLFAEESADLLRAFFASRRG